MSRGVMAGLALLALASLAVFAYILRQSSLATAGLAAHGEVEGQLRRALDDQKKLAQLDPRNSQRYHTRFDSIAALIGHLRVVQLNRRELASEVEQVLLAAVAVIVASGIALHFVERRNRERRLVRLETALGALSRGEGDITLGERRRDVIGRIAGAIEKSSRLAAQNRRRLLYLEHLSAWQEAARRHAHEIRTPLTAARMEVERLAATVQRQLAGSSPEIEGACASILEEIDHLGEFTRSFTSFATIPKPRTRELDLRLLVDNFCTTFTNAWPGVRMLLDVEVPEENPVIVIADGEMLRQVLVNLAGNSALAFGDRTGTIAFTIRRDVAFVHLDVADDGPGITSEIRTRLFEPYATSRGIGEGMGLGLAISKKILLDHGGDLDLIESDAPGATFRLTLPAAEVLS